jgi:hypothetical protein
VKIETALQKPRTVQQLMKLTGLSRGGVLSKLKRIGKSAGKDKRKGLQGPAAKLYVLRAARKAVKRAAPAEVAKSPDIDRADAVNAAVAAIEQLPTETTAVETTPPTYVATPEIA